MSTTKRQRIEHLIQRGQLLANVQQDEQTVSIGNARSPSLGDPSPIYPKGTSDATRRSSWTPEEDEKLQKLVQALGRRKWSVVARHFPSRDRKRCRERFENHVNVSLRASNTWTTEDDQELVHLKRTMGPKWAKIAKKMDGKSAESVKNRCLLLARRTANNRRDRKKALPQRWLATEKEKLRTLVATHGARNWLFIASQLPRRTDLQCLQQWYRKLDNKVLKGKAMWTQSEDQVLVEKVAALGRKWTKIAAFLPGRIGNQCRERFINHLDPSIKKTPWTIAEDKILSEAIAMHATQWVLIAEKLPGRSENAIKNHYYSRERRRMLSKVSHDSTECVGKKIGTSP